MPHRHRFPIFVVLDGETGSGDESSGNEVVFCWPPREESDAQQIWFRRMLLFLGLRDISRHVLGQEILTGVFRVPSDVEVTAPSKVEDSDDDREQAERLLTVGYAQEMQYQLVIVCPVDITDDVEAQTYSQRVKDAVQLVCPDLALLRTNAAVVQRIKLLFSASTEPSPMPPVRNVVLSVELEAHVQSLLMDVDSMDLMWHAEFPVLSLLEPPSIDHAGSILLFKDMKLASTLPERHAQRIINYLTARGILAHDRGGTESVEFIPVYLGPTDADPLPKRLGSTELEDFGVSELVMMQRYGLTYVCVSRVMPGTQPDRPARVAAIRSLLYDFRKHTEDLEHVLLENSTRA